MQIFHNSSQKLLLYSRSICGRTNTWRPRTIAEPGVLVRICMMATSKRAVHTVDGGCAAIEILECGNLRIAWTGGLWNCRACEIIQWDRMGVPRHLLGH